MGSSGCTICPAGSWGQNGMSSCVLCSPGTYSSAGASACTPCPAGVYGNSAGLVTSACSGPCSPALACPLGTAYPPPATDISCAPGNARAAPAALGLLLWPAAHPANPQKVDLIITSLSVCQQLGGTCSMLPGNTVMGADSVMRYIVGRAADLHLEAAEQLTCSAASGAPAATLASATVSASATATASATSTCLTGSYSCSQGVCRCM
jgi:hypothetical protein